MSRLVGGEHFQINASSSNFNPLKPEEIQNPPSKFSPVALNADNIEIKRPLSGFFGPIWL
jgi:hypothetical protein